MFKSKTSKIIGASITIIILISFLGKKMGWWGKPDFLKVSIEKVEKRSIIETVSASGKVQPELEVKISPDVPGEIVELYVKEGQEVKKGDLLCKIKPDLYEAAVNRSSAAVNTAKANLANSKARLAQVKANFENIKSNFERNKKLFEQGAISQQEYDASKAQYESNLADIEATEENVRASQFSINSAEAGLKESNDNLNRTSIYSPVNGIISKLNIELGERVVGTSQMAGTEIMRIANINDMEVNVEVNENDIVRVSLNDTAEIEVDAYLDRKFKGIVTEIANSANTVGQSTDQVTNFSVKIRILSESYADLTAGKPGNYSPFRPGMSATVDIKTNLVKDVLSVPITSVTPREEGSETLKEGKSEDMDGETASKEEGKEKSVQIMEYVFIHKDGKAIQTKVKSGIQDNNYIQILTGLNLGDEVIIGPYEAVSKTLKNDMSVNVVPKDELYKSKE
jgi:HlyD family secretion protein